MPFRPPDGCRQSQRVCQVVGISQEQRSDSGCGGNLVHVGEPFYRFNHHRRQQIALGVERPQIGMAAFMLFRRQAPQPGCVAWTGAANAPWLRIVRIAPGRIPHVADSESEPARACPPR